MFGSENVKYCLISFDPPAMSASVSVCGIVDVHTRLAKTVTGTRSSLIVAVLTISYHPISHDAGENMWQAHYSIQLCVCVFFFSLSLTSIFLV